MDSLVEHANNIGFKFSVNKTQFVQFCRLRVEHEDPHLMLNNHIVECKETVQFFGLNYGCTVYGGARPSKLKVLDLIHGTDLRLALGAFRTSPFTSMCCESGIPTLKYRR